MRRLLPVVLCFAFWLLPSGGTAGGDGEIKSFGMLAQPLTYRVTRAGVPVPVLVTIRNPEMSFSGAIEAQSAGEQGGHVWQQEVNFGKGIFRFFVYPQIRGGHSEHTVLVTVSDGKGRLRESQKLKVSLQPAAWSVMSVTGENRRLGSQDLDPETVHVTAIRNPDALPDRWYGYKAFDAVFWDTYRSDTLSYVQDEALADWIVSGGRLILVAKEGDTSLTSPVRKLVPSLTLNAPPREAAENAGAGVLDVREFPAPGGALFAEKRFGVGSIAFLRVDFNSVGKWAKEDMALLLGSRPRAVPAADVVPPENGNPPGNRGPGRWPPSPEVYFLPDPASLLRPALARMCGYTMLDFNRILVTIVVYILLVSAADYLVLRRLRRLPWTWLTFPAVIMVFSAYSFHAFYKGELGPLTRHEFTFWNAGSDGGVKAVALSCIRNNSSRPVRFDAEPSHFFTAFDDETLYGYRQRSRGRARDTGTFVLESIGRGGRKDVTLPGHVGSYRFFAEEWLEEHPGMPFSCALSATPAGEITGSISNNTGEPCIQAFILYNDKIYGVDNQMRVKSPPAAIGMRECREFVEQHYYGGGREDPLAVFARYSKLEPFLHAVNKTGEAFPYAGGFPVSGTGIFSAAREGEGVLIAFFREKPRSGGLTVDRIKCIRQLVEIRGGSSWTCQS